MRRSGRAGFSLVEMVAALIIFTIGVVAILEVLTVCLRSTGTSVSYTQACFLGQGLLEQTLTEDEFVPGTDSGDFGTLFPAFTWAREISDTDVEGLYQVRIEVAWPERGRDRTYELATLAAER